MYLDRCLYLLFLVGGRGNYFENNYLNTKTVELKYRKYSQSSGELHVSWYLLSISFSGLLVLLFLFFFAKWFSLLSLSVQWLVGGLSSASPALRANNLDYYILSFNVPGERIYLSHVWKDVQHCSVSCLWKEPSQ